MVERENFGNRNVRNVSNSGMFPRTTKWEIVG